MALADLERYCSITKSMIKWEVLHKRQHTVIDHAVKSRKLHAPTSAGMKPLCKALPSPYMHVIPSATRSSVGVGPEQRAEGAPLEPADDELLHVGRAVGVGLPAAIACERQAS